ncbi:MAG: AAA family ATPase [Candidatus Andersenbacteria bacterium]
MESEPKLIIITGRPGSGKTTLAKKLGESLFMPVVVRDEIKEGYINTFNTSHNNLPDETNGKVTRIFFENVDFLLSRNVSLVAEAAFQHHVWEPQIAKWKETANIFFIICEIDADVAAERHIKRGVEEPKRELYHGDNKVVHFKKTGEVLPAGEYTPPSLDVPTLKVSTLDGYAPSLEEIEKQITESIN